MPRQKGPAAEPGPNQDLAHMGFNSAVESPKSPMQIHSGNERQIMSDLKRQSSIMEERYKAMEKQHSAFLAINTQFPESDSLNGFGPQSLLSNQLLNQFSLLKIDSLQESTFVGLAGQQGELN